MRNDDRFEIERAFDLLPHVAGASWAVIWYRLNGIEKPTRDEFHEKVLEYFELLNPLFESFSKFHGLEDISKYVKQRRNSEIEKIKQGLNPEIEKRYDRYLDYG